MLLHLKQIITSKGSRREPNHGEGFFKYIVEKEPNISTVPSFSTDYISMTSVKILPCFSYGGSKKIQLSWKR